jgi:hypothetical protein
MKEKKERTELPMWAVVGSIIGVVAIAAVVFTTKGAAAGDASKEELTEIRSNQKKFGSMPTAPAPAPPQR